MFLLFHTFCHEVYKLGWLASNLFAKDLFFSKLSLLNTIIGIIKAPFLSLKYVSF